MLNMPFDDGSYDVVCCFQVLEHLPFEHFRPALDGLFRVARKAVILSLPDAKPAMQAILYIPRILYKKILWTKPFIAPKSHTFDGEHYWEINKKGYPLNKIKDTINAGGGSAGLFPAERLQVYGRIPTSFLCDEEKGRQL